MPKAVKFDKYGDRNVLHIEDVPRPTAGPGEVVVEVRAAGVNPGESAIREGKMDDIAPATFPSGQGSDFAGVVTEVGAGVEGTAIGDAVLGWSEMRSSQADYVVVPAKQVVDKPAALPWDVAGALYVVGVTAQVAVGAVDPQAGETVLVSAAAGGVGSVVVQLLRLRDVNVIGIASADHHDWLRSLSVVPVAHGPGLTDRVRAAATTGVAAVIDAFGEEYVELGIELGVSPDRIETIIAFDAARKHGTKAVGSQDADDPAGLLEGIADLVATGEIIIPLAGTFPLSAVQAAYEQVESRHSLGKVVLIPG